MPTSSLDLGDELPDLLWSLWEQLGIPGAVARRHAHVFIDPEPLIAFTALHGRMDPRLRDESIDWAIANGEYVSKARLKGVLRAWSAEGDPRFGRYAATVNKHSDLEWPADDESAFSFRSRGHGTLKHLASGALISLRIRMIFGVSARSEILRVFLTNPDTAFTATDLALETAYVRRQVLRALDSLRLVGLIRSMRAGPNTRFALARPTDLGKLVGDVPSIAPRWQTAFGVLNGALELLDRVADEGQVEASVSLNRFFARYGDDIAVLDLEDLLMSEGVLGKRGVTAFRRWAARFARSFGRVAA